MNSMKKSFFIAPVISMLLVILCISVHAQDKVRVTGMATIHGGAVDIARDKAIDNAQRNAVEEKVGVMITSFSEVENFQVKVDQILSESKGFINTYRVLSEGREGDTYKVTIEADVGMGKLKERMEAIALIMVRKSKPRLMLIFSDNAQKDAIAEAAMARYFIAQGFTIVDAHLVKKSKDAEALKSLVNDRQEVARLARSHGAEVVILGKVEVTSRSFKMGDIEVSSHEVTASGKVVNGDTGEIIATDSRSKKGEMKITTEEVARDLARQMKDEIIERWSSELTNVATVKLIVSGLRTYRDLSRFKELLATSIKGYKQMHQRSYSHGEVELDMEIRGNTQGVADDLETISLNGRKIQIREITHNKIEAKLQP